MTYKWFLMKKKNNNKKLASKSADVTLSDREFHFASSADLAMTSPVQVGKPILGFLWTHVCGIFTFAI